MSVLSFKGRGMDAPLSTLLFILFVFSLLGWGGAIRRVTGITLESLSERYALDLGIGTVFCCLLSLALVCCRLVMPVIFWGVFLGGFLLGCRGIGERCQQLYEGLKKEWKGAGALHKAIYLLMLVALLCTVATAYLPVVYPDQAGYHYYLPRKYLETNQWHHSLYEFKTFLCGYGHFFYLWGFALGSATLVNLLTSLMIVSPALAIYAIARRFFSSEAGLYAASMYLFAPVVMRAQAGTMDFFATFFALLALYLFLSYVKGLRPRDILLLGAFCGFTVGVKLNAFPVLILPLLALVVRVGSDGIKLSMAVAMRRFLAAAFLALILLSPFLVWNYNETGNPLFPFLADRMGDKGFTVVNHAQGADAARSTDIVRLIWNAEGMSLYSVRNYLPALAIFFPIAILALFRGGREQRLVVAYVFSAFAIFFLFMRSISGGAAEPEVALDSCRYFLPVFAAFSIPSLDYFFKNVELKIARATMKGLLFISFSIGLVLALLHGFDDRVDGRLRVITGVKSRDEYLREKRPEYAVKDVIAKDSSLLLVGVPAYYIDGRIVESSHPGYDPVGFLGMKSAEDFAKRLGELGIDYVLVSKDIHFLNEHYRKAQQRIGEMFPTQRFDTVLENDKIFVARVKK